jgi:hypothetical protein
MHVLFDSSADVQNLSESPLALLGLAETTEIIKITQIRKLYICNPSFFFFHFFFSNLSLTKSKDESLLSVRSTGYDIRSRDVNTHGTAGPQVQSRSAKYGKGYARGFSLGSNPKPGDPAEN